MAPKRKRSGAMEGTAKIKHVADIAEHADICNLVEIRASNVNHVNLEHIGHYLEGFTVPGTHRPYVHNMAAASMESSHYQGTFQQIKDDFQEENIFLEMLDFLYLGDDKLIADTHKYVATWEETADLKWALDFFQIIDSHPSPLSTSKKDCYDWCKSLLTEITKKVPSNTNFDMLCEDIIIKMSNLWARKDSRVPFKLHNVNTENESWKGVLELMSTLLGGICSSLLKRSFGSEEGTNVLKHHQCQYKTEILKVYKPHEKIPWKYKGNKDVITTAGPHDNILRGYRLLFQPDLVFERKFTKRLFAKRLKFLTVEIGSENINISKAFSTTSSSESSSGLSADEMISSDTECMDTANLDNTDGLESVTLSHIKSQQPIAALEHFAAVGDRIMHQHLLELLGTARYNRNVVDENNLKLTNGLVLSTAGMLVFHNAIFLTRLDAKIFRLDGVGGFDNSECGKYVIWNKVLSPWAGQWTLLAKYILACSMGDYFIDRCGKK